MSANRVAFQSLLAKARNPSMRSLASLMSRPWALVSAASVKRRASAPCFSVMARGSMTFPFVFDIFCPFSSRTMGCRKTVRKGTSPMKWMPIIIIRATQKKMMSCPVSMTEVG